MIRRPVVQLDVGAEWKGLVMVVRVAEEIQGSYLVSASNPR